MRLICGLFVLSCLYQSLQNAELKRRVLERNSKRKPKCSKRLERGGPEPFRINPSQIYSMRAKQRVGS